MRALTLRAGAVLALVVALVLGAGAGQQQEAGAPVLPAPTVAASALPEALPGLVDPTASPAAPGRVLAAISIPRLNVWSLPVIEGIAPEHFDRGMGHFPGTALPGDPGNSAYAGHRWQGPLYDFERLRVGDRVIVEQDGAHWVYRIFTSVQRILPSDVWVIDPVAGEEHMLTLTTCWPKNGSSHREFVRARLIAKVPA